MWKSLPFITAIIFWNATTLLAVAPGQALSGADQQLLDRLNQLEAETQALRAELQSMRQNTGNLSGGQATSYNFSVTKASNTTDSPAPVPPVPWAIPLSTANQTVKQPVESKPDAPQAAAPTPVAPLPQVTPTEPSLPPAAAEEDYYTLDEIKAEMKKLVWKKGDFTITPYGYLWGAMVYETERSRDGDFTYYVYSPQDYDKGLPTFHVDAKSTRLGFDVLGPRIPGLCCAQSGGKVEFDFQGASASENKGAVLLRHAYWEVKNEEFRLLGGQTWDVISPLMPGTIMYTVYWGAGNIGYRRAQFRGERYLAFSDVMLLSVQGSLNGNIIGDTAPAGITGVGDQSDWPILEGRVGLTMGPRGKKDHPIILGVSSHVGEQRFCFTTPPAVKDLRAKTWSLNADLKVPISDRFGFQGEYYIGENLSAYQGGILQGYDFYQRESIYDTGGWMEVWYDWTPKWHTHVGYTVDSPNPNDISVLSTDGRIYNQAIWGNLIYDVTKQFNCGIEVGSWRTLYKTKLPAESLRIEFMARYGF